MIKNKYTKKNPSEKRKENILEKRIVCEELECNRYELQFKKEANDIINHFETFFV